MIAAQNAFSAVSKQLNFSPQFNASSAIQTRKELQDAFGDNGPYVPSGNSADPVHIDHLRAQKRAKKSKFAAKKDMSRTHRNRLDPAFHKANFGMKTPAPQDPATAAAVTPSPWKDIDHLRRECVRRMCCRDQDLAVCQQVAILHRIFVDPKYTVPDGLISTLCSTIDDTKSYEVATVIDCLLTTVEAFIPTTK